MVGTREVRYLEGEHFHAEIFPSSECDGKIDLPEGNGLEPGYNSMKRASDGRIAAHDRPMAS